jgi:hypothetical protein
VIGLVVEILGDASKLAGTVGDVKSEAGGLGGILGGSAVKVAAFAGVAGIAAAGIASMTEAAAADRDEQAKLEAAIAAAGAATETSNAQVDEAIRLGQERAFSDSETRDAMQSLVTATGDVTAATALLGPAQDIARLAGVDLATAADAVAKAQAGQDGALRKLVPGLEKGATAADTLAAASAAAAGQADLFASSSEGMSAKTGDALGELAEEVGSVFLPVLDAIIPALLPLLDAFGQLVKALLPALIPLVKLLAGALKIAADVLVTVVGWLVKLVDWISTAASKVGDFLDKLNPLSNFKMPSLPFLSSSPASAGSSAGSGRSASSRSSSSGLAPVVNVYTTGDGIEAEQAVVRALRRVTRLNGGVVPALGWTGAVIG